MSDPWLEPLSPEQVAESARKRAADLAEARDRFRLVLVLAGVPVEEAANVLAGLEAQGFTPAVREGWGVLNEGMLVAEYGNPNGVRHESLTLGHAPWEPIEARPEPPWVYCAWSADYNVLPTMETCTDPAHDEHRRTTFNGSMHRASPDEVEALRAQAEPTP